MYLSVFYIRLSGLDLVVYKSQNKLDFLWETIWSQLYNFSQNSGFTWLLALFSFTLLFLLFLCIKDIRRLWAEVIRQREELNKRTNDFKKSSQADISTEETASIIHEIKQPISAMTMLAELAIDDMKDKATKKRDSAILEQLQEIQNQGHRCSRIMEKMQNSSNEADSHTSKPTDINQIIGKALEETKYYNGFEKITVQQELQENLPSIELDSQAIEQVFTNLMRNAVDAMENSNQKVLTVVSHNSNGGIHVKVSDTGKGVKIEKQNRIFNSFYTTKGNQGVGIGLSISKSIIEDHNGTISVSSEVNNGTKFTVFLPL